VRRWRGPRGRNGESHLWAWAYCWICAQR